MNAAAVLKKLKKRNLTLSVGESVTGGLLGHMITNVPGSSDRFRGGVIAYTNGVKRRALGVRASTLKKYGAVSKKTAEEMADGTRKKLRADIAVSVTGIAGPAGGTRKTPVGTVFVSVTDGKRMLARRFTLRGGRVAIKKDAAAAALKMLEGFLG
jgi:PncC family amidohydrolase